MLIRIVKLTIDEENISSFEQIFSERKEYIRNHKGCSLLELYRDNSDPRIFLPIAFGNRKATCKLIEIRISSKPYGQGLRNYLPINLRPGVFKKLNL